MTGSPVHGILDPFQIITTPTYRVLRFNSISHTGLQDLLKSRFKEFTDIPLNLIINCEHAGVLEREWLVHLIDLQKRLLTLNCKMRFLLVQGPLREAIKAAGFEQDFITAKSLRSVTLEFGVAQLGVIDQNFIEPFFAAVTRVIQTQTSTQVTIGTPFKEMPKGEYLGDVCGVINVVSETFSGIISISYPRDTFLKLMSRMIHEEYKEIDAEIAQGAGEFANMIFGQAKVQLNNLGYGIHMAIPSVVIGSVQTFLPSRAALRVVVPCETDVGKFHLEICISSDQKN